MKSLVLTFFILISPALHAMRPELNGSAGAQTSWPVSGQFGIGGALNFDFLSNLKLFPYAELLINGVEYIDKKVYFKELNYGAGVKYYASSLITRITVGRILRTYEGLSDESFRLGLGLGRKFGNLEATANYHYYNPLEKRAFMVVVGLEF